MAEEVKVTESQPTQPNPSVSESKPAADATPAPTETTPEVKPAAKVAESDLSSELDSADDGLDLDEIETVKDEEGSEKAEAEPPVAAAEAEKAKPAEAEKPVEAAKTAEEVKPKPAETPTQTQPASAEPIPPAQNLEEVQEQFKKWRNESEELLAKHHYALPEAVVKEYEEDGTSPKLLAAIPRMMSRVYLDAVQATMGQIMTHLPQLMSQVTKARDESSQLETKFYEQWPKLRDKPEFADTVRRIGTAYRQINPRATADDFIREVGAGAMIALRLPVEAPAAAAQPSVRGSFRPAAATRPASPKPAKPTNMFEELAEGDKIEELDLDN